MLSRNLVLGISTLAIGGTLVANTFNGSNTLNEAKNHLTNLSNTLVQFKSNETKLVGTVNTLKQTRNQLQAQVTQLQADINSKQSTIDSLNNQITSLNTRIAELEQIIANGGNTNTELQAENERLTNELVKANEEINKANQLVASLQAELNNSKIVAQENKPLTESEINTITETTTTTPQEPPTTPTTPTYDYTITSSSDEYQFDSLNIMIIGNTWIFEGTAQYPIVIKYVDGTTQNASPNSNVTISKSIDTISYKTSQGVQKLVDVNR